MPIGAALPFLINAGSSLLTNVFGIGAAARERKFARENWQKQNEYNSPAAQMARYRAAGMNPGYASAGGMSAGSASPLPDSANKTHAVEVPNQLDTLKEYFSLKNAELENSRLQELRDQAALETDSMRKTHDEEVNSRLSKYDQDNSNAQIRNINFQNLKELFESNNNPEKQRFQQNEGRYQMEYARSEREKELFPITKGLSQLDWDWKKIGVNPNDNIFVRLLSRLFNDRYQGMFSKYFK